MRDASDPTPLPVMDDDPRDEAVRFGRYLLGRPPAAHLVARYVDAIERLELRPDARDRRLLAFVRRHPRALGFVDGGLALRHPGSVVRGRLLVMAAILEADPANADRFLPAAGGHRSLPEVAIAGVRAGVRTAVGLVLLAWI
jgi:hypothetical protein